MLLDAAEELFGFKLVFARGRAAQEADVEHNKIATSGLDAVEHVAEMV